MEASAGPCGTPHAVFAASDGLHNLGEKIFRSTLKIVCGLGVCSVRWLGELSNAEIGIAPETQVVLNEDAVGALRTIPVGPATAIAFALDVAAACDASFAAFALRFESLSLQYAADARSAHLSNSLSAHQDRYLLGNNVTNISHGLRGLSQHGITWFVFAVVLTDMHILTVDMVKSC
ncbi:hypothetical protein BCR37DRAFT_382978 [Protomyces lactucae-debilis]|uniref:Uncharacterized protein n=1 Tax=Protomyces lactucae-debilis TaxID=2754530 RepID=A0A1Y2EZV2_PROLT|nr:uncharacterized protein BCR37DRAFT_382978 [Protomyces lactucae-debilis]ORY76987.1 hypothetical protein BCR37DRAFT_382978 [Protomyces lactucae-debilis]